jgi:predicted nucleotidyltransferase
MSDIKRINRLGLAQMPEYVHAQIQYEVIMGSFAYGVSSDTSDRDVYGFCVPNKDIIFPHVTGQFIFGYDKTVPHNFEQWQQHHIVDASFKPPRDYDCTVFNITKYFRLCADGNPNMIDSLFVPRQCITHSTQVGTLVRENRHLFLSKKCWHTFKGYAYQQMHKMTIKDPKGKRKEYIEKYGYDIKFAYHVVRLLNEVEQLLIEGDLDLMRNREQLKDIRRGNWSEEKIIEYFNEREKDLESLYKNSDLPHKPQYGKIRELLYECLEMHFTNLKDVAPEKDLSKNFIDDILIAVDKFKRGIS